MTIPDKIFLTNLVFLTITLVTFSGVYYRDQWQVKAMAAWLLFTLGATAPYLAHVIWR